MKFCVVFPGKFRVLRIYCWRCRTNAPNTGKQAPSARVAAFHPESGYCRQCREPPLQFKAIGSPCSPLKAQQRDTAKANERRNILCWRSAYTCSPEKGQWQSDERYSVPPSKFGYLKGMIFMRSKGQQFLPFDKSNQCAPERSCLEDLRPLTAPFKRHCWHVPLRLSALAVLG